MKLVDPVRYSLEDTAIDDHLAQVGLDGHASQDTTQGSQLIIAVQGMHRWRKNKKIKTTSTVVGRQWHLFLCRTILLHFW